MKQVTITFADGSSNVLPVTPSSTVKFEWLTDRGPGMTPAHNEDVYAVESLDSITVEEATHAVTAAQSEQPTHAEPPVMEPVPAAEPAPVEPEPADTGEPPADAQVGADTDPAPADQAS